MANGGVRKKLHVIGLTAIDIWPGDCPTPLLAKYRTTKKPGSAYAGKSFWRCPKPMDESLGKQCEFLVWEDEAKALEEAAHQRGAINAAPASFRAQSAWPVITPDVNQSRQGRSLAAPGPAVSPPTPSTSPLNHRQTVSDPTAQQQPVPNSSEIDIGDSSSQGTLQREQTPPSTPRKAAKRDDFATPRKQASTNNDTDYPSPVTGGGGDARGSRSEAQSRKRTAGLLDLVSPFTSPTPTRSKDVGNGKSSSGLFTDLVHAFKAKNIELNGEVTAVLHQTCAEHDRRALALSEE